MPWTHPTFWILPLIIAVILGTLSALASRKHLRKVYQEQFQNPRRERLFLATVGFFIAVGRSARYHRRDSLRSGTVSRRVRERPAHSPSGLGHTASLIDGLRVAAGGGDCFTAWVVAACSR